MGPPWGYTLGFEQYGRFMPVMVPQGPEPPFNGGGGYSVIPCFKGVLRGVLALILPVLCSQGGYFLLIPAPSWALSRSNVPFCQKVRKGDDYSFDQRIRALPIPGFLVQTYSL